MLPAMVSRLGILGAVFRNDVLRRLEAAYLLFSFGEWATWVAVIVYAYGRGGATEAGLVVFASLVPSVVLAPAVAALGDRFARDRVLLGTYAAQAVLMAATGLALATDASAMVVYAFAIATSTLVALSRPLHAALMPEVVASPDDLTATNVVSGMAESAGSLIGPLGAGILIGIGGPAAVFGLSAVGLLIGSLAVLGVVRQGIVVDRRAAPAAGPAAGAAAPDAGGSSRWRAMGRELGGGIAAILADRRLLAVVVVATWATLLVGAMDILYAVLAIEIMGLGDGGVGFVGALGGVGAIVGAAGGLLLVGRERLGFALIASAILFGGGVAAIGAIPGPAAAAGLLVLAGMGSGLTYVGAQTLIHRLAGDDVMSRVFGVLQGLMMGSTAIGAIAVPVVISVVGERATFVVAGLSLPVILAFVGWAIVHGDRLGAGRAADLRLLRGVPMLAPLSGPVLERLAAGAVRSDHPAGTVVIQEGAGGDHFHVVVAGDLAVSAGGNRIRGLGPGDGFGEIALIKDVPRTATVTAVEAVTLLSIERGAFLEALGGQHRSRTIAAVLVDDRLTADVSRS
jgi:MFS family permease